MYDDHKKLISNLIADDRVHRIVICPEMETEAVTAVAPFEYGQLINAIQSTEACYVYCYRADGQLLGIFYIIRYSGTGVTDRFVDYETSPFTEQHWMLLTKI